METLVDSAVHVSVSFHVGAVLGTDCDCGLCSPVSTFTRNVRIERSREQVWDYLTNFRNANDWIRGFHSLEFLTPGPLARGSKFKVTRTLLGRTQSQIIEVIEVDSPRLCALRSHTSGVDATFTYRFIEAGRHATVVNLAVDVTPATLFASAFVPLATAAIKKFDGDQVELLKTAVERESKTASASEARQS
jgi:carbon monoxide dehydrogenase subunit G